MGELRTRLSRLSGELLPVALSVILPLLINMVFEGVFFAAQQYLECISASEARGIINFVSVIFILSIVGVAVFLVAFQALGAVSSAMLRMAEFLSDKIRFIIEMAAIYLLFVWGLDNAITEEGGCASVKFSEVFTKGPVAFRLVGAFMRWLGLWKPTT